MLFFLEDAVPFYIGDPGLRPAYYLSTKALKNVVMLFRQSWKYCHSTVACVQYFEFLIIPKQLLFCHSVNYSWFCFKCQPTTVYVPRIFKKYYCNVRNDKHVILVLVVLSLPGTLWFYIMWGGWSCVPDRSNLPYMVLCKLFL